MKIRIVEGDLLDQDVEVIVNAWNRNIIPWGLILLQSVSGAIKKRAGYAPFRELAEKSPIPLGGAIETSAGKLPIKAIHPRRWYQFVRSDISGENMLPETEPSPTARHCALATNRDSFFSVYHTLV